MNRITWGVVPAVVILLLFTSVAGWATQSADAAWSINRTSETFSLYRYSTYIYHETRRHATLLASADTSFTSETTRLAQTPAEEGKKKIPSKETGWKKLVKNFKNPGKRGNLSGHVTRTVSTTNCDSEKLTRHKDDLIALLIRNPVFE